MKSWGRGRWLFIFTTAILLSAYFVTVKYYKVDLRPRAVLYELLDPPGHDHLGLEKNVVVNELNVIHKQLVQAAFQKQPPSTQLLHQLAQLIFQLEPRLNLDGKKINETVVDVCAEKYMGPVYGQPYFKTGFVRVNCTNSRPLHTIISFAIYFKNCAAAESGRCGCKHIITDVLGGIQKHYSKVGIHVTLVNDACESLVKKFERVVSVKSTTGTTSDGDVWNELVDRVKTKYVVVARDLYHFWNFTSLERQIDVISNIPNVQVVGGSFRNGTRHWHVGCLQGEMRNYVLKYQSGYHISRNECMFCDHLMGPFVALKEVFVSVPLDSKLPDSVVFADFFLTLKEKQIYSMNCPDVMYYSSPSVHGRDSWQALASKWSLNYIIFSDGSFYKYSCEEACLSCKDLKLLTRFYLMPPCCIEQMALAVRFLDNFCSNKSIHCEFLAGSVLGAVKMADIIPWDLDGDAMYNTSHHFVFKDAQNLFEQNGLSLSDIEDPACCDENGRMKSTGYIQVNTPQMYIEMWGAAQMADEVLPPEDLRGSHTLMKIHDVWVNGPPSPGLFARNRYGQEILKHAQSWIHVGKASSWEEYEAGHFKPCPKHTFHSCLDRFPVDGSLGFKLLT